jgi:outer membrane protein OmpA-like peptidoglycan-associated protein
MKRMWTTVILSVMLCGGSATAGDLSFPQTEKEIVDALSFKEATLVHKGQEYVSTKEGDLYMLIDGKRFRMKGIGGLVHTSLVPKVGALVTFDTDSAKIKDNSFDLLGQYGNVLADKLSNAKLIIEGHTDDYGTDGYNHNLSKQRAEAVKKYLMDHYNISEDRLLIRGAGESRPIAPNKTNDGRALNRRVEFIRIVE